MVHLCVTVVDVSHRKMLLPWENVQSHLDTDTIREFFTCVLVQMLSGGSTTTGVPTVSAILEY